MKEEPLLGDLPDTLAVALRLRRARVPDTVVATALGVPVEGVPALIEVAEAKLARLRQLAGERSHSKDQ